MKDLFFQAYMLDRAYRNKHIGNTCAETTPRKDCASAVTFSGEAAIKIVELLSDNCACKTDDDDELQSSCTVKRPTDCGDLDKSTCKSGIYKIFPDKTSGFKVFCEMKKHGGGWTVFQRRMNGKTQFYRDWDSYKRGFGNQNEEFWLGNDHLHHLTSQGKYKLRIDMEDFENNRRYALYEKFGVGSESSGYILDVSGYSGDAGDSMEFHNGQKFSTKDRDNDKSDQSCAVRFKGGWCYNKCHTSNLNGLYLKGKHKSYADGVNWYLWNGHHYSMKETIMMIRKA
ncbi:Fibrinogen-like protein A,Ryncolin-4,Angiopoietin-related protein 7,Angiopoietin-related protein 1,Ficolin-3,Ficolin-1-B,Techylectin-5A,Ficolin-2,Ryncolin-1,Tenascin-R,Fibrinogen-like protein 1,Angiopoietin-1,Tenascin-X,Fibrinogen C domain-containing protein 1-A,Tenascin-N,Veficolin-1,Ryncolin-3,Tenascin,Fibroleukin, Fibrinogen C domain-containing protein 1,Fibrinogen gamma chain,Techylectin-like protein,Ryncolin-2,Fibrinogen beta chain,Angiopoietin-related protein 6,Techylectin-5B,Angiopoietin-related pro|uniref:Fibrinogen C-terminal domain-containing protein n=1 Tax=Mytilus coruscus TaxID=42192 RepID=A0A6J8B0S4_MYTCO|nr:Fibrinogen-like protein A,Ryncolin-4,Angiopoietin-related protein 7,Angiopoietin-related protein 1,Ficolin-3,Ficolin-1-B,Techylectin-5A,Ficolin-2,Ryncolin-1,Tenascin-R,Fibrinogen-like protein 1,Angiopoietin-1,Tenascin-X,Fibrinogen C domain-containing protein 1-A,Tenascin-N,Veficolin-1,Ryncolin-3,Tenascin,Fibroleukin, Fibrinogen C domain-containing protein 1,Fibrinogen gamma chain,Techylectin-like protein,Ryncolin-2,Fibrinogen beta chain,Angiopoietin-related protein 6,Techylectin-5B,Angiopoietin-